MPRCEEFVVPRLRRRAETGIVWDHDDGEERGYGGDRVAVRGEGRALVRRLSSKNLVYFLVLYPLEELPLCKITM